MKFKILFSIFGLALVAFILTSSSGGRATAAAAGNTGAPGDSGATCVTCHGTSAAIGVDLQIDIFEQGTSNTVAAYTAGQTYDVRVRVNTTQGSPSAYGFQIVALEDDAANTPVNTWANPASNVQIATIGTGRQYAEHNGASSSNTFTMQWTAPNSGADVKFYAGGNGVNNDGGTGGDNADLAQLTLPEFDPTSTTTSLASQANIYSNIGQIIIDFTTWSKYEKVTAQLFNINGQLLETQRIVNSNSVISTVVYPKGMYFVQLRADNAAWTQKLIIQ